MASTAPPERVLRSPTAIRRDPAVDDAAFLYVDTFTHHANVASSVARPCPIRAGGTRAPAASCGT